MSGRAIARLAGLLVRCFPARFRDEFGADVLHLFLERWRDAGPGGFARRTALLLDLVRSAGREWGGEIRRRRLDPARRLDLLLLDLKHQVRWLARSPAFAIAALGTLAAGIGVTTAIFGVVHGVLIRPLPFDQPEQLGFITRTGDVSVPDAIDWRARSRSWESIAVFARAWNFDLTGLGAPEPVLAHAAEPDFFRVLRVKPLLGRTFQAEDDPPGGPRVIVITEAFWRSRFGPDSSVIGRTLTLSGNPLTIIGVVPSQVDFLDDGIIGLVPLEVELPWSRANRGTNNLDAIGRIAPGADFDQARLELTRISTELAALYPETNRHKIVDPMPLAAFLAAGARPALIVVLAAVIALLLIGAVNLAGLLLARAAARRRELAVRSALGAGRSRITRLLVVEGVALGVAGGGLGLVVAVGALALLRRALPASVPRLGALELSGPVLAFGALVAIGSGLVCGLIPAAGAWRTRFADLGAGRGSTERGRRRAQSLVVAGEIALAVAILAGAGILVKSFARLWQQPLGFEPDGVLMANLVLPEGRYAARDAQTRAYTEIVDRLEQAPGVTGAAYVTTLPLYPRGGVGNTVLIEGREVPPDQRAGARARSVYGDYFGVMRIPILQGRNFTPADRDGAVPVAIVNRAFARRFLDPADPIGRRVAFRDWHELTPGPVWMTVVGVVEDVKALSLSAGDEEAIYLPFTQRQVSWQRFGNLVLRTQGPPADFSRQLKESIWSVDPLLAPTDIQPLTARRASSAARERFLAVVISLFAISAVLLVIQGLWGVVSFAAAERRREIGVRLALGAAGRDVIGLVTRQALVPAILGAALGVALALASSRLLSHAVFEVSPTDPTVLGGTVLALAVVAVLASAVPAWRATRIDPLEAIRE